MATIQPTINPFSISIGLNPQMGHLCQSQEAILHSPAAGLPVNPLPIMFSTMPTWQRHTYVVHIVDFKVKSQNQQIDTASVYRKLGFRNDIESGIFIQTHRRKMSGVLYLPPQQTSSLDYELHCHECADLTQYKNFDSESPIGFIYKKDYEKYFENILLLTPPPQKRGHNAFVGIEQQIGNDQDLPPMDSTD
ncbi:hypothetical protein F66182_5827 [Fusarium sp. NRRL 66182]|nr:hypothetical protein F66182_5827 [Fusarium sp. NRRL 66182]